MTTPNYLSKFAKHVARKLTRFAVEMPPDFLSYEHKQILNLLGLTKLH